MVKLYNANIVASENTEALSEAFIDTAVTFYERVLSLPIVAKLMHLADEDPHNPFEGASKIQTIIGKAKSPENIAWSFCGIWDMYRSGQLPDGLSLRALQGKDKNNGGKGIVDLLLYKRSVRAYLLEEWSREAEWPGAVLAQIQAITDTHEHYRDKVGFPDQPSKDFSWKCGWPDSIDEFWDVLESLVFTNSHDEALRMHMRNRKTVEDALGVSGLSELLDGVKEKIDKENENKNAKNKTPKMSADDDDDEDEDEPAAAVAVHASCAYVDCERRLRLKTRGAITITITTTTTTTTATTTRGPPPQ